MNRAASPGRLMVNFETEAEFQTWMENEVRARDQMGALVKLDAVTPLPQSRRPYWSNSSDMRHRELPCGLKEGQSSFNTSGVSPQVEPLQTTEYADREDSSEVVYMGEEVLDFKSDIHPNLKNVAGWNGLLDPSYDFDAPANLENLGEWNSLPGLDELSNTTAIPHGKAMPHEGAIPHSGAMPYGYDRIFVDQNTNGLYSRDPEPPSRKRRRNGQFPDQVATAFDVDETEEIRPRKRRPYFNQSAIHATPCGNTSSQGATAQGSSLPPDQSRRDFKPSNSKNKGPVKKGKTCVRPEDGQMMYYDKVSGDWMPAGYHKDYRAEFIAMDGQHGSYPDLPTHGNDPLDITSYCPAQRDWTEEKNSILDEWGRQIMCMGAPADFTTRGDPGVWVHNGLVILDKHDQPVKNYRGIPRVFSTKMEGFRLEGNRRVRGMKIPDLMARMPWETDWPSSYTNKMKRWRERAKPTEVDAWIVQTGGRQSTHPAPTIAAAPTVAVSSTTPADLFNITSSAMVTLQTTTTMPAVTSPPSVSVAAGTAIKNAITSAPYTQVGITPVMSEEVWPIQPIDGSAPWNHGHRSANYFPSGGANSQPQPSQQQNSHPPKRKRGSESADRATDSKRKKKAKVFETPGYTPTAIATSPATIRARRGRAPYSPLRPGPRALPIDAIHSYRPFTPFQTYSSDCETAGAEGMSINQPGVHHPHDYPDGNPYDNPYIATWHPASPCYSQSSYQPATRAGEGAPAKDLDFSNAYDSPCSSAWSNTTPGPHVFTNSPLYGEPYARAIARPSPRSLVPASPYCRPRQRAPPRSNTPGSLYNRTETQTRTPAVNPVAASTTITISPQADIIDLRQSATRQTPILLPTILSPRQKRKREKDAEPSSRIMKKMRQSRTTAQQPQTPSTRPYQTSPLSEAGTLDVPYRDEGDESSSQDLDDHHKQLAKEGAAGELSLVDNSQDGGLNSQNLGEQHEQPTGPESTSVPPIMNDTQGLAQEATDQQEEYFAPVHGEERVSGIPLPPSPLLYLTPEDLEIPHYPSFHNFTDQGMQGYADAPRPGTENRTPLIYPDFATMTHPEFQDWMDSCHFEPEDLFQDDFQPD